MEDDKNPHKEWEFLNEFGEMPIIPETYYKLNINKVESLEDVKLILKHLDLGFSPQNKAGYEEMKHLLILN